MLVSPLTLKNNINLQLEINKDHIINEYGRLGIDVTSYFSDLNRVSLYRCLDTGYSFFHPFDVQGDSSFYSELQKFNWYYMPWRWEHSIASKYLKSGMRVLEVGCGTGGFLREIFRRNAAVGLELNEQAIVNKLDADLDIRNETIQDHSKRFPCAYDVVCSFQVLEHVSNVNGFVQSQLDVLRPGGKLIISVPNNGGFLGDSVNPLNLPPHHMGLWDESSLLSLQSIFKIRHVATHFEPLQLHHRDYFIQTVRKKGGFRYLKLIGSKGLPLLRLLFPKRYQAYTIQMVFEKEN